MNQQQAQKIIDDTQRVFSQSIEQTKKYKNLSKIDNLTYKVLHRQFLNPLDIVIDCNQFINEIQCYDNEFVQWGTTHLHLPRYGLALVNQNGLLTGVNDPINGSLYQYNEQNPNNPIFETDCTVHTPIMDLPSLSQLSIFNGYWIRSNVFKWEKNASFLPHVDTILPSAWYRLWATMDDNVTVRYFDGTSFNTCTPIEQGRLYLVDTSLIHDATATSLNYQLFLSANSLSTNILTEHLLNK